MYESKDVELKGLLHTLLLQKLLSWAADLPFKCVYFEMWPRPPV